MSAAAANTTAVTATPALPGKCCNTAHWRTAALLTGEKGRRTLQCELTGEEYTREGTVRLVSTQLLACTHQVYPTVQPAYPWALLTSAVLGGSAKVPKDKPLLTSDDDSTLDETSAKVHWAWGKLWGESVESVLLA